MTPSPIQFKVGPATRLMQMLKTIPVWISLPVCMVVFTAGVFLVLVLLPFIPMTLLEVGDAWSHTRLNTEMVQAGIAPPTMSETDCRTPQPTIKTTSPNGAWTMNAPWRANEGYDWELINNKTGQVFYQGTEREFPSGILPSRISILWSPNSSYLSVTTISDGSEHFRVLGFFGPEPKFMGPEEKSASMEDSSGVFLDRGEEYKNWSVQEERSKALRWVNDADLEVIVYVEACETDQPYRIDVADREIYHFEVNSFVATVTKRVFYEKFITDL